MALTTVTSRFGTSFRHLARTFRPAMYSCVVGGCPSGPQPTSSNFFGAAADTEPLSQSRTSSPNRNRRIMAAISVRVRGRGDRDIIAGEGGIRQQQDKLLWQTSRSESILRREV